ncbi:MAG: hypothetical protein HC822_27985, partial [Oscillochloris sp.]|nr:hypothetical protein [Oscillochloris sp.]
MNQRKPATMIAAHTSLPRLTLIILTLFLGILLAACAQEPVTPTDEDLGFEEPAEGLEGTPIPGQGGLTNEPNEPVVTSPEAVTEGDGEALTLSDVVDNPEQFIGQTVTIQAPL